LAQLLPAVHRRRDLERGGELHALLALIEQQVHLVEGQVAGLYDDLFIETCAEWVVPYIGELVGAGGLHDVAVGRRADVANTIFYRRRKGVAPMLERLARDVTGWDAHVVPGFELLAWTQNDDHLRCDDPAARTLGGKLQPPARERVGTVHVRDRDATDRLGGPFERTVHSVDVRSASRYGTHKAAFFLWRLQTFPLQGAEAALAGDARRWAFSSLGNPAPLFAGDDSDPECDRDRSDDTGGVVEERDVAGPVRPLAFSAAPESWYGEKRSFAIDGIGPELVICKDLSAWAEPPPDKVAIDVRLGRIALGGDVPLPPARSVRYRYGFSAAIGGGPYPRERRRELPRGQRSPAAAEIDPVAAPSQFGELTAVSSGDAPGLAAALAAWGAAPPRRAVIQLEGSGTHQLAGGGLEIEADDATAELVIQARNEAHPTLIGNIQVKATTKLARLVLDGLLLAGELSVEGELGELLIRHCTLVPGHTLRAEDGRPVAPELPSLRVARQIGPRVVRIERSIVGPLRIPSEPGVVELIDSILDAPERGDGGPRVALAAPPAAAAEEGAEPGPVTRIERSTVFGAVHVRELALGSSSIFAAGPLRCDRQQRGCLRFCSFEAAASKPPRRFRCQPDLALQAAGESADAALVAARVRPRFSSVHYGAPAYAQLADECPAEIAAGGEDGSEIGAFHHLHQPQREANLRLRLDEYLPFGLEPDLIHVT
jgi:hypothetical protein